MLVAGRLIQSTEIMTRRLFVLTISAAACLCGQNKPVLTPADYGKFETLGVATLSPDGKWLAYAITRAACGRPVTSIAEAIRGRYGA